MSSRCAACCSLLLSLQEVDKMLASASKVRPGNDLFRTLGDNGESSVWVNTHGPSHQSPRIQICSACVAIELWLSAVHTWPQKASLFLSEQLWDGSRFLLKRKRFTSLCLQIICFQSQSIYLLFPNSNFLVSCRFDILHRISVPADYPDQ